MTLKPTPRRTSRPVTGKPAPPPSLRGAESVAEEIVVLASERTSDLARLLGAFEKKGVNLKAICIPEASDFGLIRMLAEPHEAALEVLQKQGLPFRLTPVLALELGDRPGALGRIFSTLARAGIAVRYVYGSIGSWGGPALLVLETDNLAAAARAIRS